MKFRLFYFLSLVLLMLVTGVFWGTWFTLTRSLETFSPGEFIHIGKAIIANVAMPMRFLMPACILVMIINCWLYPVKRSGGFSLQIASLILVVITLLITLIVLVPIDNEIKTWTAATVPADFEATRVRWQWYHALRTLTSVAGFCCLGSGMPLFRNPVTAG
jgi:uncharacterized membrane protein